MRIYLSIGADDIKAIYAIKLRLQSHLDIGFCGWLPAGIYQSQPLFKSFLTAYWYETKEVFRQIINRGMKYQ